MENKKVKLAKKESTAHKKKTKTELKVEAKSKQFQWSWRNIKADDELVKNMNVLIGRPKVFKSPEYLLDLFNNYLLSCMKKTRKAELVPIKTENNNEDELLDILDEEIQSSKWDGNKINNKLVSNWEIVEDIEWKITPTKWWFCSFCGWISHHTLDDLKNNEDFLPTILEIDNTLESIRTNQAAAWKINSRIAEFVLNTSYWRVPNQKVEQTNTVELDATKLNDD